MSDDAKVPLGDNSTKLIKGWLAVHYTIKSGGDVLKISTSKNAVVGRLQKYFNDNKSTKTQTTLAELLAANSNALMNNLKDYAGQIRAEFSSGDDKVLELCKNEM